ncbi:cationic amino acid transporter 4-like isoform X2 [Clavelina lepadiformis]|uniref:cationic amino acid transporter 4-like isoform X2 n=1 Tax=Clavelina lepadiformis TaxID=159417 RepID=UPI004041A655
MSKKKVSTFFNNLLRKKSISEDMQRQDLLRCFGLVDLTFLAISGMIGSGLYVLAGTVARNITGPSIVISYLLAAVAAVLSAICYAEFAARIPVAGSAYQFTYLSVGEFWAFLIGWNVALEHTIYVAAIAKTCSGYLDGLAGDAISNYMNQTLHMDGKFVANYPDFLAAGFILFFAFILVLGVKLSSKVNIVIATINVVIIIFIIATGIYLAKWDANWIDVKGGFFPHGWSGTISGATILVYSYVGYEVVASATEEAINAGRDIPLALLIAITVVVISFVGASGALTLIVPWYEISPTTPYPSAYEARGWIWAKYVVSIGAMAAMVTCLLSIMFVIPRYLLAMARDGLLWNFFTIIHSKTQVPYVSTIIVALVSSLMAVIFSLTTLVEFIAVGQLLACTFVAACVIKLRYAPNKISSYHRSDNCVMEDSEEMEVTELKDIVKQSAEKKREGAQNEETLLRTTELDSREDGELKYRSYDTMGCNDAAENRALLPSEYGTIKKSILYSRLGFLVQWTAASKPGDLPFYSLMVAVSCSTSATIMLLFGIAHVSEWWFITIFVILVVTCLLCLGFISLFIQDDSIKTYQVPLVPFLPFISIVINIALMLKLRALTWIRLGIWIAVGLVIYFSYGYSHSKAGKKSKEENEEK